MGRTTIWVTSAMLMLSACSGEGGSGGERQDGAALDAGLDAAVHGDASLSPGDMVDGGDGGVDVPTTPTPPPLTGPVTTPVMCGDAVCKCSDGKDNDADGRTDLEDPECISSWDNDESSFATGIPGDNRDEACQDCFFDGNSGSGNDGCRLPTSCLREGNASSGHGSCKSCEQSDQCVNFCKAYTPNGCDCFGCCSVHLENGSVVNVVIGAGCNIDGNTVEGCTSCVPNDSCVNECGRCELCPGKSIADLPADCQPPSVPDAGAGQGDGGTPPPPAYTCDDGAMICNGPQLCPEDYDCQFGCCVLSPIILL